MVAKSCRLKKGECRKIAAKFNVAPNYVTAVKNGSRTNNTILEAIIEQIDFQNRESARLKRQLNRISNAAERISQGNRDRRANKPRQDN